MNKREFLNMLASAAVAAPVAALVSGQKNTSDKADKKESTYDRVLRTGVIRCGYTPYSVGLNRDPNSGALFGIYKNIIEAVGRKLELEIEWSEEIGWGQQIEGLQAGRYDIISSPVSVTGPRSRTADFTIPLYFSPVWSWVRADDHRFDDKGWPEIDKPSVTICTMDGEQTEAMAKFYFPQARRLSIPQNSDFSVLMQNVVSGKADLTFAEPLSVYEFMENNPGALRQIKGDEPLTLVPNVMMLRLGEPEFKAMMDNVLGELFLSGAIDKAIDAYEKYPDSYVRAEAYF